MSIVDFGDKTIEDTFYFHFNTSKEDGTPLTLAGSPALEVYEDGVDTPITAGLTLDVDTGVVARVGLHEVEVVATVANGYDAGKDYTVSLSAGTVDGKSVIGSGVAAFSLNGRSSSLNGYVGGFVYFDSGASTTGTSKGVNGTLNRPVSDEADAATLANLFGRKIWIANGPFVLDFAITTKIGFYGAGDSELTQSAAGSCDNCSFSRLKISGDSMGGGIDNHYYDCIFNYGVDNGDGLHGFLHKCIFNSNSSAVVNNVLSLYGGGVKGSGVVLESISFKLNNAISHLHTSNFGGHINILEMTVALATQVTISGSGYTKVTLASGCAGGTVHLSGFGTLVDSSLPACVVTRLDWEEIPTLEGYKNGYVYLNAGVSNTNIERNVDGVITNPVSTYAAAKTLADQLGKKIYLIGNPGTQPVQDFTGYVFQGGAKARFNGSQATLPDVTDCKFYDMEITGGMKNADTSTPPSTKFYRCFIGDTNVVAIDGEGFHGACFDCVFRTGVKLTGKTWIYNGRSASLVSPDATEFVGTTLGSPLLHIIGWAGNITLKDWNNTNADVDIYSEGGADIVINSDCILGTMITTGMGNITDNSGASFTVNTDKWQELPITAGGGMNLTQILGTALAETSSGNLAANFDNFYDNDNLITTKIVNDVGGTAAPTVGDIADAVWDELRAGHLAAGSFGEYTNSNLVKIEGSGTIDTLTLTKMFENIISHAQGDVVRTGNTYTYKKQDGTTTTFAYTVSGTGRT